MKHDFVKIQRITNRYNGKSQASWKECYLCGCLGGKKKETCEEHIMEFIDDKGLKKLPKLVKMYGHRVINKEENVMFHILKEIIREQQTNKLVR